MDLKDKNVKQHTVLKSFSFALEGIIHAVKTERNIRIHISIAIVVLFFAMILSFSIIKISILLIVIGIVISLELMNSAIERTVDLVTDEYKLLAKQAKDLAAGAVFIFTWIAILIGVLFFYPPIIKLF